MLVAFSLTFNFSKIVCPVSKFRAKFELALQKHFLSVVSNHSKSEIFTVNWIAERVKIRQVYSTEFLLNRATIRAIKLDCTWLVFAQNWIRVWNVFPMSDPPSQTLHLRPTISDPPSQTPHLRPPISAPISGLPSQTAHIRPPISGPLLRPPISDPPSQALYFRPSSSDPPSQAPSLPPQTLHLGPSISGPFPPPCFLHWNAKSSPQ